MEKIEILYISNAGVLIKSKSKKIMIDGLHKSTKSYFSSVKEELLNTIINGEGEYKDIDYLIFTHSHGDHYTEGEVNEYTKNNKVKKIILPNSSNEIGFYDTTTIIEDDIKIRAFRTTHAGEEYKYIDHYSYILEIENKSILILGDAYIKDYRLERILKNESIDILLVNFLILNKPIGRDYIKKVINPKDLIVYHIPFEEDNRYGYREIAKADIKKYKEDYKRLTVFFEELESIKINLNSLA